MIDFRDVSKSFGTQQVLSNVSFVVHQGERVGIVGPNGAGKSTIFELMNRHLELDKGAISFPGTSSLGYVRQQLNPHKTHVTLLEYAEDAVPALRDIQVRIHEIETRLEHVASDAREAELPRLGELQTEFEHLGGYELRNRAEATLSGLGFAVEAFTRPFHSFSGGWQIRAELVRTLVSEPDILLLDEPTNYLDVPAVEWLQDFLRNYHGTLMLISHDRYLLNRLTAVTLEVAAAQVVRYHGNYEHYVSERCERLRQALAASKNVQRRRDQIERFVERFRSKNTKATQVQSRLKMLDKMETVSLPQEVMKPTVIRLPEPPYCGEKILQISDAGVSYDGHHWVLQHLDLKVEKGEKVAVVGLNGMGKTTLLRVLAGRPHKGKYRHRRITMLLL